MTMRLDEIDINQCPDEYHVPNAFKGTDKCDRASSYVRTLQLQFPRRLLNVRVFAVCADSGT